MVSAKPVDVAVKRRRSHVTPVAPLIDLNGVGRLTTANVLAVVGYSHSTLYARLAEGRFPKPDIVDGRRIYWRTSTIRAFLEATP